MITVSPARPADVSALAQLAEEMDRFYGASEIEPIDVRQRRINDAIFSDPPSAYALVAWDGGILAGFASYSFLWPAVGLTRSLYLKEMYVAETARRKGVGKLLMRNLYDIAIKCDCSRVEWTTDRDNVEAQRFYAELGVPVKESKLFYRIEGNELRTRGRRARTMRSNSAISATKLPDSYNLMNLALSQIATGELLTKQSPPLVCRVSEETPYTETSIT